jgi:hypothetical protein
MKDIFLISIIFAILVINSSCHRNRLKTNEKELVQEILLQEITQAEKDAIMRKSADSLKQLKGTFKLKEERNPDPKNPPVTIDIAGSLNNIKEIKLSEVATTISYIRMEPVPDSTIPGDLKFKYYLMDNYIVALNLYGIHLYSKEGRYIRSVVKNELTGVIVEPGRLIFWNDYTMKGGGNTVQAEGDILLYNYSDNITGQKYIMKFDCSSIRMKPDYKFDPENPDQISGLGDITVDLNHGNTVPPPPRRHQGMFSGSPEDFFKEMGLFMLDPNSYAVPTHEETMMVILNSQGDTLSEFTRLEKLVNYTKTMMRGTDGGTQYEAGGTLYLRPAFNDTVFRINLPNRLAPVYVLELGEYKVSKQQGVDPGFNLTGKIIPEEWAETPNFIFLTYTKDDYDCPNTRNKKTVKIYHALYSKQNKNLSVIKGDPFNYSPEILENNIDGGVPVWPLSYMISKKGEIMIPLKGSDLKARVKSKEFKLSGASEDNKKELEKLAGLVSDADDILMIIR